MSETQRPTVPARQTVCRDLPPLQGNPLLDAHRLVGGRHGQEGADRDTLIARYGFAIPNDEALGVVARHARNGVVEIGAGTGYWARLLHEVGVDVLAYDLDPPPSPTNPWFAGSAPWFPVGTADEAVVADHAERTLLLLWPTRKEVWAARAAELFYAAGGRHLVFVGEGPGGRTGDDSFQALLGAFDRCWTCAYGITDAACICLVRPMWRRSVSVELPHWEGMDDNLHVYERMHNPERRTLLHFAAQRLIRPGRPPKAGGSGMRKVLASGTRRDGTRRDVAGELGSRRGDNEA